MDLTQEGRAIEKPSLDIYQIRLNNTRKLILECGSSTRFADRIQRSATQVSRFAGKAPTVNIGDDLARHIEDKLNKPYAWLDQNRSRPDRTINEIRRHNARALAKSVGGNAVFSEAIGRETTQVSRFIGKNPTKNIGDALARHIEASFSLNRGWLDQNRQQAEPPPTSADGLSLIPQHTLEQLDRAQEPEKRTPNPFGGSSETFAFTLGRKTSQQTPMQTATGKSYPAGSIIFVDPKLKDEAQHGDPVLALLTETHEHCFRLLHRADGQELLIPTNPNFPVIEPPFQIIGKVIGTIIPEA